MRSERRGSSSKREPRPASAPCHPGALATDGGRQEKDRAPRLCCRRVSDVGQRCPTGLHPESMQVDPRQLRLEYAGTSHEQLHVRCAHGRLIVVRIGKPSDRAARHSSEARLTCWSCKARPSGTLKRRQSAPVLYAMPGARSCRASDLPRQYTCALARWKCSLRFFATFPSWLNADPDK